MGIYIYVYTIYYIYIYKSKVFIYIYIYFKELSRQSLIITFNIIVQVEGHSDVKIQFYKRKLT